MTEHVFNAQLTWQSMGRPFNFKEYSRLYTIRSKGKPDLIGTAAPAYSGSEYHYNPEDMLVMSLSACHMLTYLAYASNSKLEVLSYVDNAEGSLFQDGKIMRFKEVILRPKILIKKGGNMELANSLHEKAHHACFIANSVNFPVKIVPEMIAGELSLETVV